MNAIMAKGLPESFLSLDDSGTLSSKQRQKKCFTEYYSKYYCKARGRHGLRHEDHAVMVTDTDLVSGEILSLCQYFFILLCFEDMFTCFSGWVCRHSLHLIKFEDLYVGGM